mmetsp:Transcript_2485/g.7340  ORF Transcript_2485/g.7340 Transcript_2485/m.7340 type:complete len:451 (-) Transcript_2485:2-1354(-)
MHADASVRVCRSLPELRERQACSEVALVGESPLRDVGLLVGEVLQGVSLAPLVLAAVLVDVAGVGPRDAVEGRDGGATQAGERPEDGALLLGDLSPLDLVDHGVGLRDARFRELLGGVLAAEGLQVSVRHHHVDVLTTCARIRGTSLRAIAASSGTVRASCSTAAAGADGAAAATMSTSGAFTRNASMTTVITALAVAVLALAALAIAALACIITTAGSTSSSIAAACAIGPINVGCGTGWYGRDLVIQLLNITGRHIRGRDTLLGPLDAAHGLLQPINLGLELSMADHYNPILALCLLCREGDQHVLKIVQLLLHGLHLLLPSRVGVTCTVGALRIQLVPERLQLHTHGLQVHGVANLHGLRSCVGQVIHLGLHIVMLFGEPCRRRRSLASFLDQVEADFREGGGSLQEPREEHRQQHAHRRSRRHCAFQLASTKLQCTEKADELQRRS